MKPIDRIIGIIRENMVANAVGQSGAYTSQGDPLSKGGFDPLIGFTRRKNKNLIDYRKVPQNYKKWVKSIKG